tara:strand:+ start:315 stop:791 length:477 start_codon:yes stop_codon:yes gene_type:complete
MHVFNSFQRGTSQAALLFLSLALCAPSATALETPSLHLQINADSFTVELAISPEQRARGLMWREQLGDDRGMLFVYPRSGDHRIWMKNTLIPLRVIWIDDSFRVISMQRLEPCKYSPCPSYSAQQSSRYILEIADSPRDINPGDLVDGLDVLNSVLTD